MDFDEDDTIVNPTQYEDKPEWGVVMKIGEGRLLDSGIRVVPGFKEGDIVTFSAYSSVTIRSNGVDFFYVRQDDIVSSYTP